MSVLALVRLLCWLLYDQLQQLLLPLLSRAVTECMFRLEVTTGKHIAYTGNIRRHMGLSFRYA